jgi:hypothetical protein
MRINSVGIVAKIAAAHHACGQFLPQVTAYSTSRPSTVKLTTEHFDAELTMPIKQLALGFHVRLRSSRQPALSHLFRNHRIRGASRCLLPQK